MKANKSKGATAKGSAATTASKPTSKAPAPKTPTVNLTPTVEAAAPKAEAKPKSEAAGKYISRDQFDIGDGKGTRRCRVAEYQDHTFAVNDDPTRRFTDEELCADWHVQFPAAVEFTPFHVRGARRDFNMGRHSKAFSTPRSGEAQSVEYVMVEGKRVKATAAPKPVAVPKAKATAEPTAEPTPAAQPPVAAKVKVKRNRAA